MPMVRGRARSGRPCWVPTAPSVGQSTLDSIRASSFVAVLQLRIVLFLYSGSEATLLSRLLVAFAASRGAEFLTASEVAEAAAWLLTDRAS